MCYDTRAADLVLTVSPLVHDSLIPPCVRTMGACSVVPVPCPGLFDLLGRLGDFASV
jgi:hypothetical protein